MLDPQIIIKFINSLLGSGWFIGLQVFGGIISLALFIAVVYITYRNGNIERQIRHLWIAWKKSPVPMHKMMKRWKMIQEKVEGDDPNMWREGILESDFMLGEILKHLGYEGGTTEERLEDIRSDQFPSLEEAWRAHGVAEFLAQDPSYPLSREVVDKTMGIYRNVFKETGIIL